MYIWTVKKEIKPLYKWLYNYVIFLCLCFDVIVICFYIFMLGIPSIYTLITRLPKERGFILYTMRFVSPQSDQLYGFCANDKPA